MRRRELSNEELNKVIKLRQVGTSWLRIQHETGIHRRTAKRAYDKWEHSQTLPELKEARRGVIEKAFLDHLKSLTTLTRSVVASLDVPPSIVDMEKNSEQFFAWLWEQDLLNRFTSIEVGTEVARLTVPHPSVLDLQSYRREKELLFECLQDHTRGEGIRWGALEEWKKARDSGAKIVPKLRKETSVVVNNSLKQEQERETNFLQKVKEAGNQEDPAKRMAEVMLKELWGAILRDKLGEESPPFQMVSQGEGTIQDISVKGRDEIVLHFPHYSAANPDKNLAEKVTDICNSVANNLRRGEMVESLRDEVRIMKKATAELREMLNPVRLTPMILRTWCELCPA